MTAIPYANVGGAKGENVPIVQGCSGTDEAGVELRCKPICWMREGNHRWGRSCEPTFHPEHLIDPLKFRAPRRILMNFTGDTFDRAVTDEQIAAMFGVMAACPRHQFLVLTKQARRMREWFDKMVPRDVETQGWSWDSRAMECWGAAENALPALRTSAWATEFIDRAHLIRWPLDNVWLGVSVMGPGDLWRVDELQRCPAAVRFISAEPLIAGIEVTPWVDYCEKLDKHGIIRDETGRHSRCEEFCGVSWVVAAPDSSGHMPHDLDWFRKLRDDCVAAGVPFMFKDRRGFPELDGQVWDQMPEVRRG